MHVSNIFQCDLPESYKLGIVCDHVFFLNFCASVAMKARQKVLGEGLREKFILCNLYNRVIYNGSVFGISSSNRKIYILTSINVKKTKFCLPLLVNSGIVTECSDSNMLDIL